MPILTTGQITDGKGILTGKWVNQSTGEITNSPPATPIPKPDLGRTYSGPGGTFVPNTPISTSNLTTPAIPLNVQQSPVVPVPSVANIPVSTPSESTTPPVQNTFIKQLEDLTSQISGKEVKKQAQVQQQTYGNEKQLQDINTQIAMHQANAMANQEKALASGETLGFASGEAQRVARNDAIETFRLSSIAQALQGNILLATKQAEASVELEFAQKQKDIQTARQNILNNYDTFTDKEKKRADAALLLLNKDDAFVEQQKKDRTDAQKEALKYVGIADILTLDTMSKSHSALEVAQIANSKGLKTLEQQKTEAEILKTKAETLKTLKTKAENKFLTAADVASYKDTNPNANINLNDTRETAQAKIDSLDPVKLETLITSAQKNGHSYDAVVKEINNDKTLADKNLALETAAKVYGVQGKKGFWASLFGQ